MFFVDLTSYFCGHGWGRGDIGTIGAHDFTAEWFLLIGYFDHEDSAVKAEVSTGHG